MISRPDKNAVTMTNIINHQQKVNTRGSVKPAMRDSIASLPPPIQIKRQVPKTYTLNTLRGLLKKYEKSVSSITARDFVRWLELQERLSFLRMIKKYYGY